MYLFEPQFFDIFGALGFAYIVALSLFVLSGREVSKWTFIILLLIGIIGLLVDVLIVYTFYLK